MNILVVDDKQNVLSHLAEILSANGGNITEATNGLDGYEKYQKGTFDLLIIDHLMPLMNGIQLLKNIKQHENDATPIIFMTTQGKSTLPELIEQSLCDWIIDKPIDDNEIISLVNQLQNTNSRLASL
ncbi:response regulator [Colwellia sp. MEBiC06753]